MLSRVRRALFAFVLMALLLAGCSDSKKKSTEPAPINIQAVVTPAPAARRLTDTSACNCSVVN